MERGRGDNEYRGNGYRNSNFFSANSSRGISSAALIQMPSAFEFQLLPIGYHADNDGVPALGNNPTAIAPAIRIAILDHAALKWVLWQFQGMNRQWPDHQEQQNHNSHALANR